MSGIVEFVSAWLGLKWGAVVGGLAGALGSLKLFPNLTAWQKLTTFAFGWAAASFLTPWIADLLGMKEHHYGSAGFLVGLLALAVAMRFLEALPEWIAAAKSFIFRSRSGGGQDGAADR